MNWRVALYCRLDNGKASKYTFDILEMWTRREARATRNVHLGDHRYTPVVECRATDTEEWRRAK